jgi:hemoglobin
MKRSLCSLALALAVLSVASDASGQATKSLYDRLGGKAAIVAVVDDFVANCAADARINKFFAATAADKNRLATFKNNLVDQICEASGGPCKYKGKDMKAAHTGMGINNADFDALVEDLTKSLNKFKVAKTDQDQLLAILGPMRAVIVEKK